MFHVSRGITKRRKIENVERIERNFLAKRGYV